MAVELKLTCISDMTGSGVGDFSTSFREDNVGLMETVLMEIFTIFLVIFTFTIIMILFHMSHPVCFLSHNCWENYLDTSNDFVYI